MCGICGVVEYRSRSRLEVEALERMTRTLAHRGPDDSGTWVDGHIGIGARRLSIVDVAGGHQPIANERGDVRIVLNGEIYNHVALRRELAARGHRFKTRSDTEVALRLYEDKGEASISRLDGMFALAIVDQRADRVIIARDRLGKKPLYYADAAGTLVFGSELKAVLAHGGVSRELDRTALHHYLSLLTIPAPWTVYRAVHKLPPGHLLVCDREGVRVKPYFDLAELVERERDLDNDAPSRVRGLLFEAVRKRVDLEVPFGAFLSGGLDSASVVAVMRELLPGPVRTFSIGFEGPASHDELPVARLSANHLGTEHHELRARPDVVSLVTDLVEFADEPLAISSCIPLLLLAREAGRHVKVVLTGDGGDEVFAGYPTYRYESWARMWRRLPRVVDSGATRLAQGRHARRVRRFVENSRKPAGARWLGWSSGFSEREKASLWAGGASGANTEAYVESRLARYPGHTEAAGGNVIDLEIGLPDEMLAKVDRMTMAASIEARSPLLDDDLVAYVAGVRFNDKLARPLQPPKPLLRAALADLLPPHVLRGPKKGFNVPLDAWFRGAAAPFVESMLAPQRIARRGVFEPAAVTRWVSEHRSGDVNACNRLFALVVFEAWAERWL
jgi:asparagine synthase (glutamine-hydrolysing)